MRANLKRKKLLFKVKTQPTNSSSSQGEDERHNTNVNGWIHNGEAKITDLIREHLQTKKKNQNERGRVGEGSRK
jgi:hypothetical protein